MQFTLNNSILFLFATAKLNESILVIFILLLISLVELYVELILFTSISDSVFSIFHKMISPSLLKDRNLLTYSGPIGISFSTEALLLTYNVLINFPWGVQLEMGLTLLLL